MRDVVERAAHALDERLDAREHGVEQAAQIVDRVAGLPYRHARVHPAGARDAAHGVDQMMDGPQRRAGERRAADERDEDHAERDEAGDVAEPLQDGLAALVRLADLHEGAVGEPGGRHLEDDVGAQPARRDPPRLGQAGQLELVPGAGHAQDRELLVAPDHAHEEALAAAGRLVAGDRPLQDGHAALAVGARVLGQAVLDDLQIALLERRGEQDVGQRRHRQRRDDEDDRVPQREAEAQRVAQPVNPP